MFCNIEFEGGCATLILIRQPLHCELLDVYVRMYIFSCSG